MNAHVVTYYQHLCRAAEFLRLPFSQLYFYTKSMKEIDQNWSPYA